MKKIIALLLIMCAYSAAYSAEKDSILVTFILVENGDTLTENGEVLMESYYVYFDKPDVLRFKGTAIINAKRKVLKFK